MIKHASELSVATPAFIDALTGGSRRTPATSASQPPPQPIEVTPRLFRLLQACLRRLDPDLSYVDWFKVAAAVFHETNGGDDGYDLFDRWSAAGRKYKDANDTGRLWKALRPDHPNPLTIATLRFMLTADGHDWLDICDEAEDPFDAVDGEGGQ